MKAGKNVLQTHHNGLFFNLWQIGVFFFFGVFEVCRLCLMLLLAIMKNSMTCCSTRGGGMNVKIL